ncbi:MAG: hypothetical protein BRD31_01720 [Bacteroidetes bacterium QH_2_64_26]|nr:MAG: hypothetical protein BRD31_01720 [Bacteroidetes bacterium QH_2_64_26]
MQPSGELTSEQIRKAEVADPGALLRDLPGINSVRRGPMGLDPNVRGLSETEVGVYIGGIHRGHAHLSDHGPIGGSCASISARSGSKLGGSETLPAAASSTGNGVPVSVAISMRTPPGSRTYIDSK